MLQIESNRDEPAPPFWPLTMARHHGVLERLWDEPRWPL